MKFLKLKNRPLLVGLIMVSLLSGTVAIAANKVVVIPLGGAKNYMYWQGDWANGTSYKIGDGVQYAGSSYVSVSSHLSDGTNIPPSSSWDLLASQGAPGGSQIIEVTSAGQVWMDRNLGALRVATKSADPDAYGSLYQWGRPGDGHEYRTSPTTVTLSDNPNHGSFITSSSPPYDWRSTQDATLWAGELSSNNPCPAGFRLPTEAELDTERQSWSSQDAAGAFASPLKLVVAGYRGNNNGTIYDAGSYGDYWSATVNGSDSHDLYFSGSLANMYSSGRAHGFSVRCLKD